MSDAHERGAGREGEVMDGSKTIKDAAWHGVVHGLMAVSVDDRVSPDRQELFHMAAELLTHYADKYINTKGVMDAQAATIARLTAERDEAVRERDEAWELVQDRETQRDEYMRRIQEAMDYANNRWDEWGFRAVSVRNILEHGSPDDPYGEDDDAARPSAEAARERGDA